MTNGKEGILMFDRRQNNIDVFMDTENMHIKRMSRICDIAVAQKEEVLILGAFGCGAFCNSPRIVAEAMARVVEKYRYDFKVIEFAVFCSSRDSENYEVFSKRLGG